MKIIFIRHGQGEHTLSPPESLHIHHPSLTEKGKQQAQQLAYTFPLHTDDMIVISPTRRTIQTSLIWSQNISCMLIAHPFVGPRMFPLLAPDQAYSCDQILSLHQIRSDYPSVRIAESSQHIWTNGINTISEQEFSKVADQFITWCRQQDQPRIYIVTHDGTINAYRSYFGESVTRHHFLQESQSYVLHI
ncbi:phosphoglycerate mutase family protein [Paenibacillus sp. KACC 21273]|uniref:histidine phosphatase family protein n=1 Tax=Paenibacillus sp. KACC 21273 TaxID=3025665 RepID=UPI00236618E6|nr:histidine phosphatase family protein [Paenibacillus sp. KACC 21273]WDF51894.1 phosphoglycerate mutase family protein [Paenibacillus sp. KACC 21273]